ncbi:recombinase family protein [Shinella daejeonensis]|uniref:recombinase family protein n=1 Tax=Shinella daejeonensis TaxID=659017 RepID=UPI0020C79371|nr:recombinase family protein [Shinella daejeonensis]MCP8896363.1 recombinase family protein [Shinella daejeonensis]
MIDNEIQKDAIIYCRVSDPKQASVRGDGLHSQERTCRDYGLNKRYNIRHVFEDMMTGERADRPGLIEAKNYIRRHKGTILIIDHPNRLGRDLLNYLLLREEIRKMGGILECPVMEFGDSSSSLLVENVVASVSQYQRQHNAEQTKSRMKARALNGFWVFQAPAGFRYKRAGRGKMLVRDEPVASVVQEALEGFAYGRFETQAAVQHFLQHHPLFPKDGTGIVRHFRVTQMLNQPLYAGYLELPDWGVSLRPAEHEGLISFQTYQKIQERLHGGVYAPRKRNVNEDFPLRGFVMCSCRTPLTACWSKGSHGKYPYYLCPKRGCENYGKSIRRDKIESEFEALLATVQPSESLFKVARAMFKDLWDHRAAQTQSQTKALGAQLVKIDREVDQFLQRIVETNMPAVITAYEERIRKLQEEKFAVQERMANGHRPAASFDKALRTALEFISSPWNIWKKGDLEEKRTVLKLTFPKPLQYARNEGFRTIDLSLPFKVLTQISGEKIGMAHPKCAKLFSGKVQHRPVSIVK